MDFLKALKKNTVPSMEDFTETDALAAAWLSYYDYIEKETEGEYALKDIDSSVDGFYYDASYRKDAKKLFPLLQKHPRFQDWKIGPFFRLSGSGVQTDILRIVLPSGLSVLSFRGATPSFDSWEECFSFGLDIETGGEKASLSYVRKVLNGSEGDFVLIGHSKGGHFALYVYAHLDGEEKKRIRKVYLFDSPGFSNGSASIKDDPKVIKFVPPRSGIGILFEEDPDWFEIVRGHSFFSYGHDALKWPIQNGKFVRAERMKRGSEHRRKAFNRWVKSLSREEIAQFVETVFTALKKTGRKDFLDYFSHRKEAKRTLRKSGYYTKERRKYVRSVLFLLSAFYLFPSFRRKIGQKERRKA